MYNTCVCITLQGRYCVLGIKRIKVYKFLKLLPEYGMAVYGRGMVGRCIFPPVCIVLSSSRHFALSESLSVLS